MTYTQAQNPPPDAGTDTEPGSRGRLVIADKVVEKIASQAAGDLAAVGGSSGGFLGIGSHGELSARPKAKVHLSGSVATIEITAGIRYPSPLRRVGEEIRRHVQEQVLALTGVEVRQVDIEIGQLLPESGATPGRRKLL